MGDRNEHADGCLYQRSAAFLTPKTYYIENGEQKVVEFDNAMFTGDLNPGQSFCNDWSCADSGVNFFSLTTGGARQGKPDQNLVLELVAVAGVWLAEVVVLRT